MCASSCTPNKKYLTYEELAGRVKYAVKTLRNKMCQGKIPEEYFIKNGDARGSKVLFREEVVGYITIRIEEGTW